MNDRNPAATLALCAFLKRQIAGWEAEAKLELQLVEGERVAARINGQTVAFTNKVRGRQSVRVLNEAALLEFVKADVGSDEVETIEQIRPAYRKKILERAATLGTLVTRDGVVWEGIVETVEGEPYLSTKLTEDAGIVINGLLAHGRIGVEGIKPERPRLEVVEVPDDAGDETA